MNATAHILVSEPARRSQAARRRREALLRAAAHLALAVIGFAMLLKLSNFPVVATFALAAGANRMGE